MLIKEAPLGLINSISAYCPDITSIKLPIIAGGFIRAYYAGEHPADLDLYFRCEDDLRVVLDELQQSAWIISFQTDRAISLTKGGNRVQLISVLYGDPSQIIDNFDFTVCCAAVSLRTKIDKSVETIVGDIYLHDDFMEHLSGRILVYTGSEFPLSSLKRAFKYTKRGYSMCDENIIALAESISSARIFSGSEELVADHIAGMDPDGGRRIRVID